MDFTPGMQPKIKIYLLIPCNVRVPWGPQELPHGVSDEAWHLYSPKKFEHIHLFLI